MNNPQYPPNGNRQYFMCLSRKSKIGRGNPIGLYKVSSRGL